MSEQPAAQEPTMEEILASIRRIISEDDTPAAAASPEPAAAPAPAPVEASPALMDETPSTEADDGEDESVLELTQRYDEPAPAPEPAPQPAPAPAPRPAPVETVGDLDVAPARAPEPRHDPRPEPAMSAAQDDTLLSDRAAQSAASAFGQLTQALLMPASGRSLEDVIKEMMRPMLKDWLDANLPAIVEEQVRAEVERIARRGAR